MLPKLKKIYQFIITIFTQFIEDGCSYRAAALSYTTLLSIVPLMTVSFVILSAFPAFKALIATVQNFIFTHFVAASGEVIQTYLESFVSQTSKLSILGFLFLILSAVLILFNMEQAFNAIWRVPKGRRGISAFMIYWGVLTLTPILLSLSILVSGYVSNLFWIASIINYLGLNSFILWCLPFVLTFIMFTFFYIAIPNCSVPYIPAIISAFISSVLFEVAKHIFAYYVLHFASYTLLYGAVAAIPIFLVWLYMAWVIILFGAVMSYVMANKNM